MWRLNSLEGAYLVLDKHSIPQFPIPLDTLSPKSFYYEALNRDMLGIHQQ